MLGRTRKTTCAAVAAGALLVAAPGATAAHKQAHQVNQGNLISALNNISVQIDRLNALNNLTVQDIRLVNVENVLNNNRVLNNSLNRNDVDINVLRNVLNDLTIQDCAVAGCVDVTLTDFLNENDIVISDVVAISVLSGGDVIVFYQ